ncbi:MULTISPECIES: hypothetical protein [Bacillus]|uniref:hypothetical protein n=1 Tax=Bacillus TaxID=1386 RepID=UPI001CD5ECA0|nr:MULTISPECIES: hypothetical protein [Bacillus]MCA1036572.1 hypothetical protein [Bacillus infantis]
MENTIKDLEAYRKQKQAKGEESALALYRKAQKDSAVNANIREKVRARHIFREAAGLPGGIPFSSEQEEVFEDWFLFDYISIRGFTMFNLFLRRNTGQLAEADLIQGALFLSSVLQPVKIERAEGEILAACDILTGEKLQLKAAESISLEEGRSYFIRCIPVFSRTFCFGPAFPMDNTDAVVESYNEAVREGMAYRPFLKKTAVAFLFIGDM